MRCQAQSSRSLMLPRSYRFRPDDIVRIKFVAVRLVAARYGAASGLRGSVSLVTYSSRCSAGGCRGYQFTLRFLSLQLISILPFLQGFCLLLPLRLFGLLLSFQGFRLQTHIFRLLGNQPGLLVGQLCLRCGLLLQGYRIRAVLRRGYLGEVGVEGAIVRYR